MIGAVPLRSLRDLMACPWTFWRRPNYLSVGVFWVFRSPGARAISTERSTANTRSVYRHVGTDVAIDVTNVMNILGR